ncbi:MAG: glycine cleavage system protein GcvH [Bdellovibrionota bacterium]|nr:MAG: glycine cleavage system protein GcvH [Bdellovibrionota bacterium]
MSIPEQLQYTKDHEWLKVEGKTATVGITHFAQSELGDIVFADIPAVGKAVEKGQSLCVVESTKAASDVYAPVSGKVVAVNEALKNSPELINRDPYGQGWIAKIEVTKDSDLHVLLSAGQYQDLLAGK